MKIFRNKKIFSFSLMILIQFFSCKSFANDVLVNLAVAEINEYNTGIEFYWMNNKSIQNLTLDKLVNLGYIAAQDMYSPWDKSSLNTLKILSDTNYLITITNITSGSDCTKLLSRYQKGVCASNLNGSFDYVLSSNVVAMRH